MEARELRVRTAGDCRVKARETLHSNQVRDSAATKYPDMKPFAVINAIIFGSAAAITFGLSGVLIVFLLLRGQHPEMNSELGPLLRGEAAFVVLLGVSGVSLLATLKQRPWRHFAQGGMWLATAAIALLYWPK
jgi:hypothetical protein